MAFMDDTVWHSENPESLQLILNDTQQLYKLNNIEINPTKSDLLHIPQTKNKLNSTIPTLYYNNQAIPLRKSHDIIRYLGIYFDGNGSTKPTLEILQNKIENFIALIRYKKLTPKQISTFFNIILQPSLEYLL